MTDPKDFSEELEVTHNFSGIGTIMEYKVQYIEGQSVTYIRKDFYDRAMAALKRISYEDIFDVTMKEIAQQAIKENGQG